MFFLDLSLFFGFPVDSEFENILTNTNPHLTQLFINNQSDYLHKISHQGKEYLGKFLGPLYDPKDLELIQANIYSIASRLAPQYSFENNPAVLLITESKSS